MEFYEPQKYKIFTFWRGWMGVLCCLSIFRCAIYLLQMRIQSSSNVQSVLFKFQLPHLWDFAPAFMMIYSCFYGDLLLLLGCFTPIFRMLYSCFYDDLLLVLWWYTPGFRMIYFWFYDDLLLLLGWFTPGFMMIYPCF